VLDLEIDEIELWLDAVVWLSETRKRGG